MLYYLHYLSETVFGPLNVFQYLTFRAVMAAGTSLVLCLLAGPWAIKILTRLKLGQPLRTKDEVNKLADLHMGKKGTPTMGGLLVVGSVTLSCLLWAVPANAYVWLVLIAMLWLAFVGFMDDYYKVSKKNSKGISGKAKLAGQLGLAVFVTGYLILYQAMLPPPPANAEEILAVAAQSGRATVRGDEGQVLAAYQSKWTVTSFQVPFFANPPIRELPWIVALVFFAIVIMGCSNAVNLTDGLDGLAIGCSTSVAAVYAIFSYIASNSVIAYFLRMPYVPAASELTIFCAALFGASLGFLWYNCHPAKIFMGDTGSLSIGGALAVVAILVHQELALVIAGAVFVMEAGSVMIQVAYFKLTKKRFFAMTPIHHHFELKGWNESTVTIRFWILSILFALLALTTLKVR
jgi:phospho-N-acetylmuramoyl-pentapeptide-transferase